MVALWEGPQLLLAKVKDAEGQDWYIYLDSMQVLVRMPFKVYPLPCFIIFFFFLPECRLYTAARVCEVSLDLIMISCSSDGELHKIIIKSRGHLAHTGHGIEPIVHPFL